MVKKYLYVLLVSTFFAFNISNASAEIKTVQASGEYIITTDAESIQTGREIAREKAKQAAVEKLGVFVKSYAETMNTQVTQDKVTIIAGSVLEVVEEKIQMLPGKDEGTIVLTCTLTARVDTDKVDIRKIVKEEENLEKIAKQNQRIKELEEKNRQLKLENATLQAGAKKTAVQKEITESQRQYLIAKYERDIDIYDLNNNKDFYQGVDIAQELNKIDPQNTTAFRYMVAYYRNQGDLEKVKKYCQQIINSNSSAAMKINAYVQLGDIYSNIYNNQEQAKAYINKGIKLAQENYASAEIERLVNGSNVRMSSDRLIGKSNALRELYVLKSDLEGEPPSFEIETVVSSDALLIKDTISNIRYQTNWLNYQPARSSGSFENEKIVITGMGCFPKKSLIPTTLGRQAAILDAYRKLIEGVQGENMEITNNENVTVHLIYDSKNKPFKECKILKTNITPDGYVEVTIEATI